MNENRIREVIEVEKKAQNMVARAAHEAEQAPVEAEAQAATLVELARAAARDEATRMIEQARQGAESTAIIAQAEENMNRTAGIAAMNLEKAVAYVLERVLGRE